MLARVGAEPSGDGYLMRSNGMLAGDVEQILTLYLRHCSVHVTCAQLARMAATLANGCVNPWTGVRMLPRPRRRPRQAGHRGLLAGA